MRAVRKGLTDNDPEPSSEIIGVEVNWVLSDEMDNQLNNIATWKKFQNGEWHSVSKKLKTSMCQYIDRNVISYTPSSIPSNSDVPRY